ncbi:MAG: Rid family detoxifying hydrolase [Gemmatimonadetes bacterium]|nr:Rid family detoxifying hydrolase [Gemmatimonadota bacterium]
MREAIRTPDAPAPKGPYSQGIICRGRQVYIAGQGPVDPETGEFTGKTFEEQAVLTFENLRAVAAAAGATLRDFVKVNAYLSDMADFPAFNEIYRRYFDEPYPARTTVHSALPGFLIEVDGIAVLSD